MYRMITFASIVLLFSISIAWGDVQYTVTDLGTLGGTYCYAIGINNIGQVVGVTCTIGEGDTTFHAFRTSANNPINPNTDDLGIFGVTKSFAHGINNSGQVVGTNDTSDGYSHAFRTSANKPINSATDDLGTFGGTSSAAYGINDSGQVVGTACFSGDTVSHAFRTTANQPINPNTDDLGTLGGTISLAVVSTTLDKLWGSHAR